MNRMAVLVVGALLAMPAAGLAAQSATPAKPAAPAKTQPAAAARKSSPAVTHTTRGVVKSMGPTSLVINSGAGTKTKDMTFALDPSTERLGDVSVGSMVAVKYKAEGTNMTAVSVQPVKTKAVARKTSAH